MQPNHRVSESGVEQQRGYAWVGSSTTSNKSFKALVRRDGVWGAWVSCDNGLWLTQSASGVRFLSAGFLIKSPMPA